MEGRSSGYLWNAFDFAGGDSPREDLVNTSDGVEGTSHGRLVVRRDGPTHHIFTAESCSVPFHVPHICLSEVPGPLANFSTVPVEPQRMFTALVPSIVKFPVSLAADGARSALRELGPFHLAGAIEVIVVSLPAR